MSRARSPDPAPDGLVPSEARRVYRRLAPLHDLAAYLLESRARRSFLARLPLSDGDRVLEMGVGTGLTFGEIVARNPSGFAVGVDCTPAMLDRARRRLSGVAPERWQLVQDDAFDPGFDRRAKDDRFSLGRDRKALTRPKEGRVSEMDAPFDLLVCTYALDLAPAAEQVRILRRWRALLVPGGHLGLCYLARPHRWYERIWDLLPRIHPSVLGGCRGIDPAPAVSQAGFEIRVRERVVQRTYPSEILIARSPTWEGGSDE